MVFNDDEDFFVHACCTLPDSAIPAGLAVRRRIGIDGGIYCCNGGGADLSGK